MKPFLTTIHTWLCGMCMPCTYNVKSVSCIISVLFYRDCILLSLPCLCWPSVLPQTITFLDFLTRFGHLTLVTLLLAIDRLSVFKTLSGLCFQLDCCITRALCTVDWVLYSNLLCFLRFVSVSVLAFMYLLTFISIRRFPIMFSSCCSTSSYKNNRLCSFDQFKCVCGCIYWSWMLLFIGKFNTI